VTVMVLAALGCGTSPGGPSDAASDTQSTLDGGDAGATNDASSCALPPSILDGFAPKRTLHVATTGNDTNDGLTTSTAWASLNHASALQPGDEVRVAAGTYPCPALASLAGNATAPIHFVADGAARSAVLDCAAGGVFLTNLQYVAFDGFEIRNATSGHCINLNSGAGPPYANLSEHVLFVNDYVHDCNLSAIKSSQAFQIEVRTSEIAKNVTAGNPLIDFVAVHDAHILGNDIHDSVSIGVQTKGGAYNCLIEGNRIHDVADTAVQLGEATGMTFFLPGYTDWEAQGSIAANNLLYGNLHAGIAVQGCNQCVVAHNTVWATGAAFFVRGLSTTNGTGASINDVGLVLEDNTGLVQGYNLYFATSGPITGHYSDTPIAGLGNIVDVNPRFVSTTTPDLHLAAGSPAIGVATPIAQVTRDFTGACRQNANLGAW
jgi:parallel beta-helix repeat protein